MTRQQELVQKMRLCSDTKTVPTAGQHTRDAKTTTTTKKNTKNKTKGKGKERKMERKNKNTIYMLA